MPRCARSQLRFGAGNAQGTATQAVLFATLIDRGPPCLLSGSMRMTIEHDGKPAGVQGNPAVLVLTGRRAGRSVVVMPSFWWGNWCGRLRGFTGGVSYDGLVQRFKWPVLPDCISRAERSSVAAVWWG